MKKILLVSDNKIFGVGGGSLEEHKYFDGLKCYSQKKGLEFKVLSIDNKFEYSLTDTMRKTKAMDIFSRLCGHSSFVFLEWKRLKKIVLDFQPDIVFLGRTRFGFIAKDIKKLCPSCKIVSNVENIEYDYVDGYFSTKNNIVGKMYILLEKWCVRRDEKNAIEYSDALNFLTTRDLNRCHSLYDVIGKHETILPICIEKEKKLLKKPTEKSLVFIGSLNYASNIFALTDFIKNVWLPYYDTKEEIRLIVGGSSPVKSIKELLLSLKNCTFYENFNSLEDIVPINSLVIAPIQKGAGMKVKVAESLSMGLMIAASDEALVGYEEALQNDSLGGINRANESKDYKQIIDYYMQISEDKMKDISNQNLALYRKFYSYNRSRETIGNICTKGLSE